ncbi:acyl-CoA dehydrogenase [Mycolicibacter terrae]|uniref:Acyl-CoA dehydrogenase n=1 Tax=Mycolicibacter terrae TaxID=1788 RepID=A0AAD1HZU7_9MYCO|nr:acyl-CoA dehydrogenase family protein [Mycolicibacter terrae]ORW98268.1 acyl-CoA dehydrogenase [Mycolicibacter terrae]BBX23913.1 acyl-CoA dehydrogenase [Mycolicibacter terrae]SNV58473.1 FadE121 protein [Mycolicibacter terrae]
MSGGMSFELTEDQQLIRQSVAELASKFDDHYWMTKDLAHEFPREFYDAIAGGGWLGMTIPEEFGGHGLGITEATILAEEVARSGGGMNAASSIHLSIFGMQPVVVFGSEEMKAETLPRIVSGDLHVCFGVTEPTAGLDTSRITTFAKRDGSDYVVNGRKVWISKAQESEKILLLTRTESREDVQKRGGKPTDGLTLFLTDIDRDHVEIRPITKMGRNAVGSNEVFIDDLRIPAEHRIGEEGKGFSYILHGLNPERMLIAAEALGIGRVALDRAVRYANERVVFDRPIGMNQGIQFPLADSLARLDAAELILRKATWLYDNGKPCGREANMAKYLCADAGFGAADRALQAHGGMGYSEEYAVSRYFRESRLMKIVPISQEMILNFLGSHVLGLPRSY